MARLEGRYLPFRRSPSASPSLKMTTRLPRSQARQPGFVFKSGPGGDRGQRPGRWWRGRPWRSGWSRRCGGGPVRAPRRLQREQDPPPMFTTECHSPMAAAGFRKQLAMIGLAATSPTPSIPTCCAMPAASRSPTAGTTPAPSRNGSATATSSTAPTAQTTPGSRGAQLFQAPYQPLDEQKDDVRPLIGLAREPQRQAPCPARYGGFQDGPVRIPPQLCRAFPAFSGVWQSG